MVPFAGPRSTSCALVTSSLYQEEKSSLCGVTPRSSRAIKEGYRQARSPPGPLNPGPAAEPEARRAGREPVQGRAVALGPSWPRAGQG